MKRYVEDPATGLVNSLPPHAALPDESYQPMRFAQNPRVLQSYLHGRDPRRRVKHSPHGRTTLYLARRMHQQTPTIYLADRPGPHPDRQLHEILRPVTPEQLHGYAFGPVLRYVVVLHSPALPPPGYYRREFPQADYNGARAFWRTLLLDEPPAGTRAETGRVEMLLEVVARDSHTQYRGPAVAVGCVDDSPITSRLDDWAPAFPAL